MRLLRTLLAACAAIVLATGAARAASTTNFTDQWWTDGESGWGAAVFQQWDTLFIDIFVYRQDGTSAWYVAAATLQPVAPTGHTIFIGDVYTSTGPYFGGAFDPTKVNGRKVGTLKFDADSTTTALLSYAVDGVAVVKAMTRQTWRYEDISGDHYGGVVIDKADCDNPGDNSHTEFPASLQITHLPTNQVTLLILVGADGCALSGTYSQLGHMGQILDGHDGCNPAGPTIDAFEIERTISGISGRWTAKNPAPPDGDGCTTLGRFAGVRR